MKKIQAIRGMNDILPDVSRYWLTIETALKYAANTYGYKEIRLPLLEFTELFARTIGETTDVVEKEMYTFLDRNGDSLTLRPEGTAGCVRAGIEHGLFYNQIQRLFYCGPMFRHERPQKGRYRQFHQFGVEAYGLFGPDIDAEIMVLAMTFWTMLEIDNKVDLQINTLGTSAVRAKYREQLVQYFKDNYAVLDEDCKKRLQTNPLRILDSKNPELQGLINDAPKIFDYLDQESRDHFDGLCNILDQLKLPYIINSRLVRGLDYYCHTVFEWVPKGAIGSQGSICAGGHYDNLVEQMGGKSTPAIGFAIGLERLVSMVFENNGFELGKLRVIYLVLLGDKVTAKGMMLAGQIRAKTNECVSVIVNCGGGSLSTQLKRADKSNADIAIILGESELNSGKILIKYLRDNNKPQQSVAMENEKELMDCLLLDNRWLQKGPEKVPGT